MGSGAPRVAARRRARRDRRQLVLAAAATPAGAAQRRTRGRAATSPGGSSTRRRPSVSRARPPVFVDITADWCVTCKVNERLILETPEVRAALRQEVVP